jgi:hypothetical protein
MTIKRSAKELIKMAVELQSDLDLKDTVRASLLEREAEGRPFPAFVHGGGVTATYGRLRSQLGSAQRGFLLAAIQAFNDADGRDSRESEQHDRWRREDEIREQNAQPMSEAEFEETNRDAIDAARRAAERLATPMSAAQGDEIASLLRDIAKKLEQR